MANTIHTPDKTFDFASIHLANPHSLQGGSYFSKILFGPSDESVYIQTPKCKTNKGIIKTGKKEYLDLLLTNDNINFIEWVNSLEERIQELIYEKKNTWFAQSDELEVDDIQAQFTPAIKIYKGSNYLVRCYLQTNRGIVSSINIFDENRNTKEGCDVTNECPIISIIEIQGLRFSQKSFQIDITVKQIMILNKSPIFNSCMIDPSIAKEPLESNEVNKESDIQPKEDVKEQVKEEVKEEVKNNLDIHLEPVNELGLEEVTFEDSGLQHLDKLTLKEPTEIYYEMYKEAKKKAKESRKIALQNFLKAKQIKEKYALEEMEDSEDDNEEDEINYLLNS